MDHLEESAAQYFQFTRDLPVILSDPGKWEYYFRKSLALYSKLWQTKYDDSRVFECVESESKEHAMEKPEYEHSIKQLGEIGSRIAQLYFHYYLRSSQEKYLKESFSFYALILHRGYLDHQNQEKTARLIKRFSIVALLCRKTKKFKTLLNDYPVKLIPKASTFIPHVDLLDNIGFQPLLLSSNINSHQVRNALLIDVDEAFDGMDSCFEFTVDIFKMSLYIDFLQSRVKNACLLRKIILNSPSTESLVQHLAFFSKYTSSSNDKEWTIIYACGPSPASQNIIRAILMCASMFPRLNILLILDGIEGPRGCHSSSTLEILCTATGKKFSTFAFNPSASGLRVSNPLINWTTRFSQDPLIAEICLVHKLFNDAHPN